MPVSDVVSASFDPVTVIRHGDTMPYVSVQFVDGAGNPVDLSGDVAVLMLYNVYGDETPMLGTWNPQTSGFDFPPIVTDRDRRTVDILHSEVDASNPTGSEHRAFPGPEVVFYHPTALWADPTAVIRMSGGSYTVPEAIQAIARAMEAVRAWASRPVPSPVPGVVREAVTTLAARALTSPSVGGGQASAAVVSERIGDYSVRYADPTSLAGGLTISGDLAALLAFLRPRAYTADIGPDEATRSLYPITTREGTWLPMEFTDTVQTMIDAAVARIPISGSQPGPAGPAGPAGDQIVFDDNGGTLVDPNAQLGANAPSAAVQAELAAAPVGSMFVDIDPVTGAMHVWQKT